jgi:hypothetical protein
MSGTYYFVIVKLEDLRKLADQRKLADESKYLMQGDIKCIFMNEIEKFSAFSYSNGKTILD